MGDIADQINDDGVGQLARHNAGECDDFCPYCDEEDE